VVYAEELVGAPEKSCGGGEGLAWELIWDLIRESGNRCVGKVANG
jgi:hypothetical protein